MRQEQRREIPPRDWSCSHWFLEQSLVQSALKKRKCNRAKKSFLTRRLCFHTQSSTGVCMGKEGQARDSMCMKRVIAIQTIYLKKKISSKPYVGVCVYLYVYMHVHECRGCRLPAYICRFSYNVALVFGIRVLPLAWSSPVGKSPKHCISKDLDLHVAGEKWCRRREMVQHSNAESGIQLHCFY